MKEFVKFVKNDACDICGEETELRVYLVEHSQGQFDSDKYIALCLKCDMEDMTL